MLSDGDILALLGDGDVSDISDEGNESFDDNFFPIEELDNLLDEFDVADLDLLDPGSEPDLVSDGRFRSVNRFLNRFKSE